VHLDFLFYLNIKQINFSFSEHQKATFMSIMRITHIAILLAASAANVLALPAAGKLIRL
jgi:hypothetical protein